MNIGYALSKAVPKCKVAILKTNSKLFVLHYNTLVDNYVLLTEFCYKHQCFQGFYKSWFAYFRELIFCLAMRG